MTDLIPAEKIIKTFGLLSKGEATMFLDAIEAKMLSLPAVNLQVKHKQTEGLYSRQIFHPAGYWVISKVHKVQHQFVLMKGTIIIWEPGKEPVVLTAPYNGITEPGTRRLILSLEDTVFITFHSTLQHTVEEIEEQIYEKRINPFLLPA